MISAFSGPLLAYGAPSQGGDYNPDLGAPSLFYGGVGLLDQRVFEGYNTGQGSSTPLWGWLGVQGIPTVSFVPSTLSTTNMANAVTPTTAVALVLTAGTGITSSSKAINRATGLQVTGLFLIDGLTSSSTTSTIIGNTFTAGSTTGLITVGTVLAGTGVTAGTTVIAQGPSFGLTGLGGAGTYLVDTPQTVTSTTITGNAGINGVPHVPWGANALPSAPGVPAGVGLYNPLCMLGRNVRITTAVNDVAVYTVLGYDIYGYPMSEAITANGATTVSGKKAFKYIASVTPVGTVGATASVGTGDVFGFPLFSNAFQDVQINWAAAVITASTGYLAGVATAPTTTTGDVRGTYAVQSASDASKRLVISQSPSPPLIGSMPGLFGVTQA